MKKIFNIFVAILVIFALFINRVRVRTMYDEFRRPSLPDAISFEQKELEKIYDEMEAEDDDHVFSNDVSQSDDDADGDDKIAAVADTLPRNDTKEVPVEYNLAVPFQAQAPFANWDMPYQEACEEASLIMAYKFFMGRPLSAHEMDVNIQKMVDWQMEKFGYYADTTSEQVAQTAIEYFGLSAELDYNVTTENIKSIISQNKLIIIPAAGRILPNPYFSGHGPLYHMLVIRGYTDEYFITNDPGTKRGEEFLYKYNDLINAVHDWDHDYDMYSNEVQAEKMLTGDKVMIVIDK